MENNNIDLIQEFQNLFKKHLFSRNMFKLLTFDTLNSDVSTARSREISF